MSDEWELDLKLPWFSQVEKDVIVIDTLGVELLFHATKAKSKVSISY